MKLSPGWINGCSSLSICERSDPRIMFRVLWVLTIRRHTGCTFDKGKARWVLKGVPGQGKRGSNRQIVPLLVAQVSG